MRLTVAGTSSRGSQILLPQALPLTIRPLARPSLRTTRNAVWMQPAGSKQGLDPLVLDRAPPSAAFGQEKHGGGGITERGRPVKNYSMVGAGELTPTDEGTMHREIGMLTAKVDMILEGVRRSEEKSDASRASMHRRMDEIVDRVSKVELTTAAVQEDVTEMRPVTDDVKRWKLMGVGALGVIGIGGMVLGVTFADAIRRVIMVVVGR